MTDRPECLIIIANGNDIQVLAAQRTEDAQPLYNSLRGLVEAAGAKMHIAPIPETCGFLSHPEPLQVAAKPAAPEPTPEAPKKGFKSRTKAQPNENGEYVVKTFADGSELISSSEPPEGEAFS